MYRLLAALVLCLALLTAQPASAHVLLTDPEARISALVHITPDDSPIAGQPAQLFFAIQDNAAVVDVPLGGYELFITDAEGNRQQVATRVEDGTVAATYTFADKALYDLELRARQSSDVALTSSIRVTRGAGDAVATTTHSWAQAGLVVSLILVGLLGITAANNSRQILKRSTF